MLLAAALLVLVTGCATSGPELVWRQAQIGVAPPRLEQAVRAPWEMGDRLTRGSEDLLAGEDLVARGQFELAAAAFSRAELAAATSTTRQEAQQRRLATLLKLGRSKQVLDEVSRAGRGRALDSLGPELAVIVAFAYQHQRDIDQTLAWLSLAHRLYGGRSGAAVVRGEAERLIRRIRPEAFDGYAARWAAETFVNSLLLEERQRRTAGGLPDDSPAPDWFNPAVYGSRERSTEPGGLAAAAAPAGAAAAAGSGVVPPPEGAVAGPLVLGLIVPLSGQYAAHGEKVRRGVELALETAAPGAARLEVRDSQGEAAAAAAAYDELAGALGAQVVLGPLLAKTAEAVAVRSRELQVPLVTFTKKAGVTALSPVVLRLGATAENQAQEVLAYAAGERGLRRIAVSATSPAAEELALAFQRAAAARNIEAVEIVRYVKEDPESVAAAVRRLETAAPEAVFVADSLEDAVGLISALRASALRAVQLLGPASWEDAAVLRANAALVEGAIYLTPYFGASRRPLVVEFRERFLAQFGVEPDLLAGQGYDAARFVLQRGAQRLREAAALEGVTGLLTPRPNGEIARRISVVEIRNSESVEILSAGTPTGAVERAVP